MNEQLEHAWKIKEYICEQIKMADSKATAVIAIATLSTGLLTLLPAKLSIWGTILIGFSGLFLLFSLILALISIWPRTSARSRTGTIFWGNIASYDSYAEYRSTFENTDFLDEVIKQIFYLSNVVKRKYFWISRAVESQSIGLTIFWISFFLIKLL